LNFEMLGEVRSDRVAGRNASPDELARLLAFASPAYLSGAFDNPALGDRELLLLLRNRQAPSDLLRQVADDRKRMSRLEVRRAVALHPRTPLVVARPLLSRLHWRELAEVAVAPQVNPAVRRQAELRLASQLDELEEGQRIALARRASRTIVVRLTGSRSVRELRALLGNPRLTEPDALRIASRESAPPELLAQLAAHEVWGRRRTVRLALLSNRRTPIQVALRLLRGLSDRDLGCVADARDLPKIVCVAASRSLSARRERGTDLSARRRLGDA
jgi:hypothetical protein